MLAYVMNVKYTCHIVKHTLPIMPSKPALRLLPNYFKKVGLLLVTLAALVFVFVVTVRPDTKPDTKALVKLILATLVILAMTVIALSREKIEDELVQVLRLRAIAFAFICAIVHTIVYPFSSMLIDGTLEKAGSYDVVFNMLILYLLIFSVMKRAR